jgi:hypothetical protein
VEFGSPTDVAGTTSMYARLNAPDAALIEQRLEELAHTICDGDPRRMDERRASALAAAVLATPLGCGCGDSDCPAAGHHTPTKNAVVYVVADQTSVPAATDPAEPMDPDAAPMDPHAEPAEDDAAPSPPEDDAEPAEDDAASSPAAVAPQRCTAPPAFVFGAGILPTALLGAILERASIREVRHPGEGPPEPRYTPSRRLAEFVRCRDLTCRFPGCDKPAQFCDVDHTVAYPVGPTHPSNLKCLCRFHHLLKTFWNGTNGWRDRQLPDGTIVWTSPTGHTYTTYPGSLHLFPTLCEPTATLWAGEPPVVEPSGDRGAMMPRRKRTRADSRAKATAAERRLNNDHVAERNKPPPF